ncbi:CRISPR-associated endonuclease Cas2 [Luteithermobacter gelatinilyticus]|uniref:CRISPR-associated endonuclease Cas2 n=1 Tax=Luteithermobacter gelatinilyticus TaxID=2582913 RepID=UPI001AEFD425|nr:CRISPR-associated endonuclease Cas2 [Luteithermobacter gelatinilyticus]|tara:strand:+ start:8895 stop:9212 length:318 start_codon:yes stop_codon:yes gene_type:complete
MWIFVMFDLPTTTKKERRHATRFRKFLIRDGYMMLQYSIYARICNGLERVEKHMKRLELELPPKGSIRAMQITDRQYKNIRILLSNAPEFDETHPKNNSEQLLLL